MFIYLINIFYYKEFKIIRNLLKTIFIIFIFVGCTNDNTSVNNIVKYKGTYIGNNITHNGSAMEANATIIVE